MSEVHNPSTAFSKIFIDDKIKDSPLAQRAYNYFKNTPIEIIHDEPLKNKQGELSAKEFSESKKQLYLTSFKGQFFKRCPGAKPGLTCCNYFVLNLGLQCDMNCSYCYLQSFINSPVMKVYTNLHDALFELEGLAKSNAKNPLRIGTGEVIDSLSLDEFTLYSVELIQFFNRYPSWTLEFKTKSHRVDQFLSAVETRGNTIVSWSVNPQNIIEREEHLTSSLEQRLAAARKCLDKGYRVAFHMDPMIWHPGWQESYNQLIEDIHSRFSPDEIPYISLGALRFQPEQRHMMRERFPKSIIRTAEVFVNSDGKMRYDQAKRNEMFQFVLSRFKELNSNWKIFLCMETPETWLSSVGGMPKSQKGLGELFQKTLR